MKRFLCFAVLIFTSAYGAVHSILAASPVPAHSLAVGEGAVNPLGYHEASPVFSWKLPAGVERQTAYRVELKSDMGTAWDSGWVESDEAAFVRYGGKPFSSRERVEWRVRFRDEKGRDSGWSELARFELGLLSNKDWSAKWIRPQDDNDEVIEQVAWLRREFQANTGAGAKARAYVTARGVFDLRINGARIGDDFFANGWTSYHKRLDTLTYDVTDQLRDGANTIEVMLGTGWFAGRLPFETKKRGPYGKNPEFIFQLEITRADGTRETVVSDENWEGTRDGPILFSSIYDGESYDARKQPANWGPVHINADLGKARLTPKPFSPVRVTQTLEAKSISHSRKGAWVFDFGQNMVGIPRMKLTGRAGQTITLRYAEMLQDNGQLYTENYRTAKSTDTYTFASDGKVEWSPAFTFHGFRYVEILGLNEEPPLDAITGLVLHTDMKRIGKFETSSAKLNQLQRNIAWGWRGNSLDIPTDCPQRDERAGWLGDAQVFCPTAMFNYDCLAFWRSWLDSMRVDQDANGRIPAIIPAATRFNSGPGWIDAAAFIPWDIYVRTGDTRVLADNFSMMGKVLNWYRAQTDADGLMPKIKGYGDWLQPHPKNGHDKGDTPDSIMGLIFHARTTQLVADIARVLGRDADAQRHDADAVRIRGVFTRNYFDADARIKNTTETQSIYVLALAFDLLPREWKPKAAAHLVRLVREEAGGHLRTGFLGTPHIARVLDENGHSDLACELLLRETYPSWLYPINQGATTMWERWNSYSHENGFGNAKMNSFNHYAYGAIGQWMYERIAGLAPDPAKPGYKHFFVRPLYSAPLDSARAKLETPHGKAVSAWEKRGGKLHLEVVVPPNTAATVELPDGTREQVGPGVRVWDMKWTGR